MEKMKDQMMKNLKPKLPSTLFLKNAKKLDVLKPVLSFKKLELMNASKKCLMNLIHLIAMMMMMMKIMKKEEMKDLEEATEEDPPEDYKEEEDNDFFYELYFN
jgi:hypothetical protein